MFNTVSPTEKRRSLLATRDGALEGLPQRMREPVRDAVDFFARLPEPPLGAGSAGAPAADGAFSGLDAALRLLQISLDTAARMSGAPVGRVLAQTARELLEAFPHESVAGRALLLACGTVHRQWVGSLPEVERPLPAAVDLMSFDLHGQDKIAAVALGLQQIVDGAPPTAATVRDIALKLDPILETDIARHVLFSFAFSVIGHGRWPGLRMSRTDAVFATREQCNAANKFNFVRVAPVDVMRQAMEKLPAD